MNKKTVILSTLSLGGLAAFSSYQKFKKLLDFAITFNKMNIKNASINNINLDLFVNFKNTADIPVKVVFQSYNIYLNSTLLNTITNDKEQLIKPLDTSVLGVNVNFNPQQLGQKFLDQLLQGTAIKINIIAKFKIRISFFTINILYPYSIDLTTILKYQ